MKITKKVFYDLAIYMMGFGLLMGIVFPFFLVLMGIPKEMVLNPLFFVYCILAGIIVGAINIYLARLIVGKRIKLLAERMQLVEEKIGSEMSEEELEDCLRNKCHITIDSEDELGESAKAFNSLTRALSIKMKTETAVKSFNDLLSNQLDLYNLANQALGRLAEHMSADAGAVVVEKDGELIVLASYGIKESQSLVNSNIISNVLRTKRGQKFFLPKDIIIDGILVDCCPKEILAEPIIYKNTPLGVIVLASVNEFSSELENGIVMFSNGLSLALRNAITYDQLQRLAANDALTGAYNRRFGIARLAEEFKRAVRGNSPLGIMIFDIDHFKSINDAYGHQVGDKVLINVTQVARMAIREGDILMRYGGEEFMVILPGASKSDTAFIAERLRRMVEDSVIQRGEQRISVTVSIGYSSYPEFNAEDETSLIRHTDEAMYASKNAGRNTITAR